MYTSKSLGKDAKNFQVNKQGCLISHQLHIEVSVSIPAVAAFQYLLLCFALCLPVCLCPQPFP